MSAFLALVRKDLHQYLGNRRALIMSLVAPVLIAAFFGSLFSGESKVTQVPIAVTDLDRSEISRKVVERFKADTTVRVSELREAPALAEVRAGTQRAAITLPVGFGAQAQQALMGMGPRPEIVLVYDPSQATVLPLVRGLMAQHVMGPIGEAMGSASRSAPFATKEVEATGSDGEKRGYNSYAHAFAGMGVQFILLLGVDVGVTFLLMRRSALWQRLRASPISKAQLLGSRMLSCAVIALGVFLAIFAVAIFGFKVRVLGSAIGLLAVMVAFALMTACFGLMIAAIGRTPEVTRGLAILVTLLLVMVGGAWVPSFLFPPWLQTLSAWTPTHWAVEGLDAMTWRAQPLAAALTPVMALMGFAAAFAAVTLATFRWEEQG